MAFHEEVLSRLTRLDEGMFESMESRVKEYERVLDRKNNLEQELGPLREKASLMMCLTYCKVDGSMNRSCMITPQSDWHSKKPRLSKPR